MDQVYKAPTYARLAKLDIAPVLAKIEEQSRTKNKDRVELGGAMVHVKSLRLKTFLKTGTYCHGCQLPAQYFAVERNWADEERNGPYHINLWGIGAAGEEVLFTHDHVIARALGGADDASNTVTFCGPCNWAKSFIESKLVDERRNSA